MERDGVPLVVEKTKDAVHDVLMVRFWNEEVRNKVYERIGGWLEDLMNRSETRGGAPRREIGDERKRTRANSSVSLNSTVTGGGGGGDEVGSNGLGTTPKESKGRRILQRAASSASLLVPGMSSKRDRSGSEASSNGGSPFSSDGGALFKRTSSSLSTNQTGGGGGQGQVSGDFGKGHASDRVDIVEEDYAEPH